MYRQAIRSTPRAAGAALRSSALKSAPRRFASTKPADKPRSWKGSALRWGLAGAALYYYNTSPAFAEEVAARTIPEPPHFLESDLKTVDAVIEEKRQKTIIKTEEPKPVPVAAAAPASESSDAAPETVTETIPADEVPQYEPGSPEALEAEAGQQGAFNPETGEINWDCPCLGGMADGPCGEEFKTAFSCFVYSDQEPKGIECIEKFQGMQECFRKYPEIYGAELADDEEAQNEGSAPADSDSAAVSEKAALAEEKPVEKKAEKPAEETPVEKKTESKPETTTPEPAFAKAEEAAPAEAPKKFSDATDANKTA
ncbi:mitochondrial intermembrane space import and assembly protein 40-B [Plectosphaerella plurivora]|uniref:Mitochondrial intermembrane space import and assembly protein 40 n=1 Tax=Plectosphaerella plurivora TaxID=936078 RepID=A0A9P8V277_9PEZI|nr:mitochondrial intermembrane space import and assembly protein 40-B [Plectosphaerella plurivora]